MLHHDPLYIEAELAYRREGAVRMPNYWTEERSHPARDAVSRWWHALTSHHTTPAPQPPLDAAPETADAVPEAVEAVPETTEARALEHARV